MINTTGQNYCYLVRRNVSNFANLFSNVHFLISLSIVLLSDCLSFSRSQSSCVTVR